MALPYRAGRTGGQEGTTTEEVTAAIRSLAVRAHAHGLRIVGVTVAPCEGWTDCTPAVDAERREVNAFIRASGGILDGYADFDAVLRGPGRPEQLLPAYDSGDHPHPGDQGLAAIGAAFGPRLLSG